MLEMVARLEAPYAAGLEYLRAGVSFGAGEQEIGQRPTGAGSVVSAPVLMAETMLPRQDPSRKITTRIVPGMDHSTVMADIVDEGLRAVLAGQVAPKSRTPA
jgi:uncharacterized protein